MSLTFGHCAEALVGIDEGGVIVLWNSAAENLFGRLERDVLGLACHDVLGGLTPAGGHLCGPNCGVRKSCLQLRAPRRFDMVVKQPDGAELWLDVVTCIVADEHAHPISLHVICESVAARRMTTLATQVIQEIGSRTEPREKFSDEQNPLTKRERDVLAALAQGQSTAVIARELSISSATVRNHVQSVLEKLSAHSRAEAVVIGLRQGLIRLH
ncbi:MAG: helix-turn-helix transcriptional regulator [Vulcanimicrobiaceae bacterium]